MPTDGVPMLMEEEAMKVGDRVRVRAKPGDGTNAPRSTLRPGEVWEGTIASIDEEPGGAKRVTVHVELLNGARADGVKYVEADTVSWEIL
jgi:hypothetical protein